MKTGKYIKIYIMIMQSYKKSGEWFLKFVAVNWFFELFIEYLKLLEHQKF